MKDGSFHGVGAHHHAPIQVQVEEGAFHGDQRSRIPDP
jgi:hypothetical protein